MPINLSDRKLNLENDIDDLSHKAERLFEHQLSNWRLAADGYKSLSSVQVKKFHFENFSIEAHFNPGRIISSSAKVDAKSINERPCFLCVKNLPQDQKAVEAAGNFILLVNPFPIFHKHFTIPTLEHTPQLIQSSFGNMLEITQKLGKDFAVFYNGPKCGASAPDHLHFQAGNFGFMNIDNEYEEIKKQYGKIIFEDGELTATLVTGCMRNFISIESANASKILKEFSQVYGALQREGSDGEPMMNIICSYSDSWRVLVFPRSRHRPSYFFEEDDKRILISPAAVDLGGVLIFPREEDFEKISQDLIVDIFNQVTYSNDEFTTLAEKLRDCKR
jgi:ATP adenylyltransferase/5',5'''-P-1,P-4-tetraphosphate phosphorylase II